MTPDQLREEAFREFEQWFIANYPGPKTIISDPAWHAPKIFRSATHRIDKAHADALEEIERLNGALSKIADYIEPHWKGAGLDLNGAWLLEEIAKRGDALEQAERRAERLKGHAEAMAPVGMLEPLRIIGDRLLAHYGDRFCLTRPTLHTDNERQVLVAALKALRAGLAYRADKGE